MKPIDQTGYIPYVDGNCFSACIASILEIPLEDVPLFHSDEGTNNWGDKFIKWCEDNDIEWTYYDVADTGEDWHPEGYSILSGKSPRGDWLHSVVALDNDIVHDPHFDRTGVESRVDWILIKKIE